MTAFNKQTRQRIIDGYLAASGRNMFIPEEFVDWLKDNPEHEMYDAFFGKGDEYAAKQHRIQMARQMASGLRIIVRHQETRQNVVTVTTREFPAYISPVAGRRNGGGYQPVDPQDAEQMAELMRQGASSLRGWLSRYRGVFEASGYDLTAIEAIAASQDELAQSA